MATHVYKERVIVERPQSYDAPVSYATTGRSAAARVIYFLLDVVEVLLALRFVLRLLGASTGNAFSNFIYSITAPLVAPFRGIFPTSASGGTAIDWSTIVAMLVYALIAYALVKLIDMASTPRATTL